MVLGRHRWVEYAGWNWRFDYNQVAPQWLGWLASLYDEVPSEVPTRNGYEKQQNVLLQKRCEEILDKTTLHNSSNPYKTNVGGVIAPHEENLTRTQLVASSTNRDEMAFVQRWGFKDPQKQDQYWIQPQQPLYMESARKIEPDVQAWVPHRD